MRGLTPAERDVLALMIDDDVGPATLIEFPSDAVEATVTAMVAQGRIRTYADHDERGREIDVYTPTAAGHLALRLWPTTMATVPR